MTKYQIFKNELDKFKTNIEKLKFLIQKQPSNYKLFLTNPKYNLQDLFNWIENYNDKLKNNQLKTKIYWILNGLTDFPKCICCGKPIISDVYSVIQGYLNIDTCSKKCKKIIATKRQQETNLKRYGVISTFNISDFREKIKQTNLKKYGVVCPVHNKKIQEKIRQKNLEKYGTEYYQQTDEFKNKVKETCLKKYGVNNVYNSDEVKEKIRQKNLEKYGTEYYQQTDEFKNKVKETCLKKYGENYKKILWGSNGNIGQSKRAYNNYILKSNSVEPLFSCDEYISARKNGKNEFLFKCKKCGKSFLSYWDNGQTKCCPYCKITETKTSKKEQELYTYILDISNNMYTIKHNDRSVLINLELDVYIPSKRIAFELDGLYWHNDNNQPNYKYHLQKTELCEKQGIQLIHIFENEWNFKRDIIKSRISNLLGIYDKIVYARKCEIKDVDPKISKEFQEENHIQGSINSKVSLGLYYQDELISLMTFGKCRFDKHHEWELLRFCNKLGYHIPGAASKLLKYFERKYNPKSLVSYADRRWSQGKVYEKLGFKFSHASAPNYWYFKSYQIVSLLSRIKFQKHKLKKLLKNFDESKTEVENMKANGYNRIFDCGNLVYEKFF